MSSFTFQKVRHFSAEFIDRQNSRIIPIYLTIISFKDGERVWYKVGYCSPEDTFKKKDGIRAAQDSEYVFDTTVPPGASYREINFHIFNDLIKNRRYAPRLHRRYLSTFVENRFGER